MENKTIRTVYHYPFEGKTIRVLYCEVFFFCVNDILELSGVKLTLATTNRLNLDDAWYWDDGPRKINIGNEKLLFVNEIDMTGVLAIANNGRLRQCVIKLLEDFRWPKNHCEYEQEPVEDYILGAAISQAHKYQFDSQFPPAPNCFELNPIVNGWPLATENRTKPNINKSKK